MLQLCVWYQLGIRRRDMTLVQMKCSDENVSCSANRESIKKRKNAAVSWVQLIKKEH